MEGMAMNRRAPDSSFWQGRRVLLTGHSGFKGSWLGLWLSRLGVNVTGLSLPPHTEPNLFSLSCLDELIQSRWLDVRDLAGVQATLQTTRPEIIFHLAAQALVRPSYRDPIGTFTTNFNGTLNILEAARHTSSVKVVVIVTTDKVYHNNGEGKPFKESDPLGGYDPYSASKASAEMLVRSYRKSFFSKAGVGVAAARAGNVIGGGDWSEDRIIPDAVRAWTGNFSLQVRHPEATRPWQHVLEPLAAYLRLAEILRENPQAADDFNFGPDPLEVKTVRDVVTMAQKFFGTGAVEWGTKEPSIYEAPTLALDNEMAKVRLGMRPLWSTPEAIEKTMNWYRGYYFENKAPCDLCIADINSYQCA